MAKYAEKKRQEDFGTEFEEKVLYINRCATVTKGGRKFSFSALILVGDGQGHVGYGFAKANEVSDAIRKGSEAARKNIYTIEMEGSTIPHEIYVEWDGAKILLKPAPAGTGIVAGSKVRSVLELGGVKDVIAKNLGSNNPLNQVKATFKAFSQLRNREECFAERKGVHSHD
ncbi:MAG TPA: 30S ribosomal protein S5 [Chlamydiales bacterium]|nr:30S ribosomal protein S5 [Chlamydiales bacterium]